MHYAYHIGQIVFLAKHYRSSRMEIVEYSAKSFRGVQSRAMAKQEMNAQIHHVNVTVPKSLEDAAKHFYGVVMGMQEVPKPESSRGTRRSVVSIRSAAASPLDRSSFGENASASDTSVTPSRTLPKLKKNFERGSGDSA